MTTHFIPLILAVATALECVLGSRAIAAEDMEKATIENVDRFSIRDFTVLKSRRITLGDRFLFLNRVAPPISPHPPAPAPVDTDGVPSEPAKRTEILSLSTTVYDRKITEIRWSKGTREFRVMSNIDFNHFTGVGSIETPDATYSLILGIGNETSAQNPKPNHPVAARGQSVETEQKEALLALSKLHSEYRIVADATQPIPTQEELSAIDALHVYYDAHKPRLVADYNIREAARQDHERWLKAHPPVPEDIVIHYWRKPSEQPQTSGNP